ncbi:anaerobic ribonucleoside-triphosphate reductase activating protein [Candidatus Woesearchaeota archaeon]|nr:anaerobic ribonucleoside-triphosphate reductase activating protein [Candidatus Woesearchaeota archaeon]
MQVYIGGIPIISSQRLPGKESLLIFLSGCDFRCPFCYASHILDFKPEIQEDIRHIKRQISDVRDQVSAVVLTGGEPLMQRGALLQLIKHSKELEIYIGIETNGSKPDILKEILQEGIDYVSMDLKAPFEEKLLQKTTRAGTFFRPASRLVSDLKESLAILKQFQDRIDLEFKTTIVPSLMFRKEDLMQIAAEIREIDAVWVFQRFRNEFVKDSRFSRLESPALDFLQNLRDSMIKEYPNLRIEIRDEPNPQIAVPENMTPEE